MPADCGELISETEPESEFDPNLVHVVEGSCSINPQEGRPDELRTFTAVVENPKPNTDVRTVQVVFQSVNFHERIRPVALGLAPKFRARVLTTLA